ncbi:hypothetical protein CLAIMM_04240 [Cladophialophora immunda]|nr:hypothetical protein CLAIMM_04240 [Cladophialophora immunda]
MSNNTAVLLVDPYNDFLHPNGKLYGVLEESLAHTETIRHLHQLVFEAHLHYQLQQRGIRNLVIGGLVANTCIEATARYAYELGYNLTMLTNATAGFSTRQKDAATELIWPLFADKVITVQEWAKSISFQPNM